MRANEGRASMCTGASRKIFQPRDSPECLGVVARSSYAGMTPPPPVSLARAHARGFGAPRRKDSDAVHAHHIPGRETRVSIAKRSGIAGRTRARSTDPPVR